MSPHRYSAHRRKWLSRPRRQLLPAFLLILFAGTGTAPGEAHAQDSVFAADPIWLGENRDILLKRMALADFDRDGDLDLFASTSRYGRVFAKTTGRDFYVPSDRVVNEGTRGARNGGLAVGDVNQDGYVDVVIGHTFPIDDYPENRIELALNSADGLGTRPIWMSGFPIADFALADLDLDGDLDLACGGEVEAEGGGAHGYYLNTGAANVFRTDPDWTSATSTHANAIALGDLDGDGDPDLVCGNGYGFTLQPLHVFLSRLGEGAPGDSLFSPTPNGSFSPGVVQDLVLGDVDADGDLDMVVVRRDSASVLLNRFDEGVQWSQCVFDSSAAWTVASAPGTSCSAAALGDVDGDGDLDLVLATIGNGRSHLFLNMGSDPWFDAVGIALYEEIYTEDIALADADGDGDLDLLLANDTDFRCYLNESPQVAAVAEEPMFLASPTYAMAVGDVDLDGDQDLVVGNFNGSSYLYRADPAGALLLPPVGQAINGTQLPTRAVVLVDLGGDGYPEFVLGNRAASNLVYGNNSGSPGSFPIWNSPQQANTTSAAAGDIDGDGRPDLLFGNSNQANRVFLNSGVPENPLESFAAWEGALGENTQVVVLADMDGDGDLDAVFGNRDQENTIYLNLGTTLADTPAWRSREAFSTTSLAVGDVDGDGYLDLVCGNDGQVTNLYLNSGGTFAEGLGDRPYPVSTDEDSTRSIGLVDVDGDGDLDVVTGNWGGTTACYLNTGADFPLTASWRTAAAMNTEGIVLADFDLDGDLDLVCGNRGQINTLHRGLRQPAVPRDFTQQANQLPNSPTQLSALRVTDAGTNLFEISLTVADAESDPVGLAPRYRYVDSPTWYPVAADLDLATTALATSPAGETYQFTWDVSRFAFDPRDVVLNVATVPNPQSYTGIHRAAIAEFAVGPLGIMRAVLGLPATVDFDRVTLGDTVQVPLVIANTGNADLDIFAIELPSSEMRLGQAPPFVVAPGDTFIDTVYLEPREALVVEGEITITSNDFLAPTRAVAVTTDIAGLTVVTTPLLEGDVARLGEALTIQTVPEERVRIERTALHYRRAGDAGAFTTVEMTPSGPSFIGVVPGRDVTEAGLEFFVELENSGVFATDPDTTGGAFVAVEVETPAGISSLARPSSGTEYLAGRAVNVDVLLPDGTNPVAGTLHYRTGGQDTYASLPLEANLPYMFGTIPDSAANDRGLEYWVEVLTQTETRLTDPPTFPAENPRRIQVTVPDLVEPEMHPGNVYRMVSVPLQFKDDFTGTLEDLLFDQPEFGIYDDTRWRSYRWLPAEAAYVELSAEGREAAFRPEPGRAFWLVCRQESRITTAPITALSTPTDGPWSVTLQPGWNQVGNPFAFPVTWDAVLVDGQPVGTAPVEGPWAFDGASYVDVTLQENPGLEPFAGYWIRNSAEPPQDIVLSIPPQEAQSGATAAQVAALTAGHEILWQMEVTAACAGVQDGANRLGVSTVARDTWDALDRHEPPAAPERSLSLYFPHSSWTEQPGAFTADYRGSGPETGGQIWRFDVAKDFYDEAAGNMVELGFAGLEDIPDEYVVSLLDRELDRVQNLRERARYAFHLGIREPVENELDARFVVLVGDPGFVKGELAELSTPPLRTTLHQNYPNPFNPETVIRWEVAQAGRVDLRIYDLAGRLIRTVHAGPAEPGGYEFAWRGETDGGRQVASGVYIYRLTTPDAAQTKRMTLLK